MLAELDAASAGASAVPWALPNENLPMRIWWQKSFKFDELRVMLPEGFKCVEVLNARRPKIWKNQIDIVHFVEAFSSDTNYVGLVVKSTLLQEELDRTSQVTAKFVRSGRVTDQLEIVLRTLRPKLWLLRNPAKLQVKPGEEKIDLPLELKYTGFGDIRVNLVATYRGQIVSQGDSLVSEVMRRLWSEKDSQTKLGKGEKAEFAPEFVNNISREIMERLESGSLSLGDVDAEVIKYLKDWLTEYGAERFRQALNARVEDLLVGVLRDLILRNPVDSVRLEEPRTRLMTNIHFPLTEISLDIKYRDLAGNSYDPVNVKVVVEYLGKIEKPIPLNIPITIRKWEHEPILNVSGGV